MQKKLLKTALFGFSKTAVCEYIARVSEEYNEKITLLTAEHTKEKQLLMEQIAVLTEENNRFKQSTVEVAQALSDARQYAAEMKQKADDEYVVATEEVFALKQKADGEYQAAVEERMAMVAAETQRLETYRDKIAEVRAHIVTLLGEIDNELEQQTEEIEDLSAEYKSEEGVAV